MVRRINSFPFLLLIFCVGACVGQESLTEVLVCENEIGNAFCGIETVIDIEGAFYGRADGETCPSEYTDTNFVSGSDEFCSAESALATMKEKCDGERTCSVQASAVEFGEPCFGTSKYLKFAYTCRPTNTKAICNSGTISCSDAELTLKIVEGFYGRRDTTTCRRGIRIRNRKTTCSAQNAFEVFSDLCNGKSSCTLSHRRKSFKNPCIGTNKYIEVTYACLN